MFLVVAVNSIHLSPLKSYNGGIVVLVKYDNPIEKHLRPNERVIWVGRARRDMVFRWNSAMPVACALWSLVVLKWMLQILGAGGAAVGLNLGLPTSAPTVRFTLITLCGVAIIVWRYYCDYRRRIGTWYALTDHRLLFVRTDRVPQSVIGIDLVDVTRVCQNRRRNVFAPANAIIIECHSDSYIGASDVLGYQMNARRLVFEDVEDAEVFVEEIHRQRMAIRPDPFENVDGLGG
jgi:hypothetical protein